MKVVKKLNVPAEFLYNQVINSVLFDIRKATAETIKEHQLKNYSYVKEFSQNNRARITIKEAIKNKKYQFETSTKSNLFNISYEITPIDEKSCEVTYTEEMTSHGSLQKLNDKLFGAILGKFKKKRFIKMLEAMEESY